MTRLEQLFYETIIQYLPRIATALEAMVRDTRKTKKGE